MMSTELIIICLFVSLVGMGIVYYWLLALVFTRSKEKSFRQGLRARGYSEREIDDAVINFLNRNK